MTSAHGAWQMARKDEEEIRTQEIQAALRVGARSTNATSALHQFTHLLDNSTQAHYMLSMTNNVISLADWKAKHRLCARA